MQPDVGYAKTKEQGWLKLEATPYYHPYNFNTKAIPSNCWQTHTERVSAGIRLPLGVTQIIDSRMKIILCCHGNVKE